jgi:hypothetical protein
MAGVAAAKLYKTVRCLKGAGNSILPLMDRLRSQENALRPGNANAEVPLTIALVHAKTLNLLQ